MWNNKTRRVIKFGQIIVSFMLVFSVLLIYQPNKANAFTNNLIFSNNWNGTGSTKTITGVTVNIGNLIVVTGTCQTSTNSYPNTVTDSASNIWSQAVRINSFSNGSTWVWFATAKSTTTLTMTISLVSSAIECSGDTGVWDIPQSGYSVASSVVFGADITCPGTSFSCPQRTFTGNVKTTESSLVVAQTFGTVVICRPSSGNAQVGSGTPQSPLVVNQVPVVETVLSGSCLTTGTIKYESSGSMGWQYNNIPINQLYSNSFAAYSGNQIMSSYNVFNMFLVFTPSGLTPVNCNSGSFGNTIGGYSPNVTTTSFVSNQTYIYAGQTAASAIITNITTSLSSISLTNSQTRATFSIAVYVVNNLNAITAANPLIRVALFTYTVVNNASPQSFSPVVNLNILANSQYVIAMGISHDGGNIYETNLTPNLYIDTADSFSSLLVPTSITVYAINTPQIYLGAIIQSQCVTTTTINSGSNPTTTVTVSLITTITILSLAGQNSGAVTQNIITYLPFWIFPLVFGGIGQAVGIGAQGLIFGFIIGTFLGYQLGLFPIWMLFILVIVLYLLIRR